MNFALLAPAALAALAALLLPLLIHLQRRPEQKPLSFAAWRWVSERVRPRQRLRWTQWLLLLLRVLLMAALVLLLAQPVRLAFLPDAREWRVLVPGVSPDAAGVPSGAEGRAWNWLAPGFPTLAGPAPAAAGDVASLLRELDTRLPAGAALSVWVPDPLTGLDAERIVLSREVAWHAVAAAPVPAAEAASPATTRIALFAADTGAAARVLAAVVTGWNAAGTRRFELVSGDTAAAVADDIDWAVVVSEAIPASIPDWVSRGGTALHIPLQPPAGANASSAQAFLSRAIGRGRLIAAALPLQPEQWPQMLEGDFPQQLREVFEGPARAPAQVHAASAQPLSGALPLPPPAAPLDGLLVALVAALFVLERLLAALAMGRRSA